MRIPPIFAHPCNRTLDKQSAVQGVFAGGAAAGLLTTLFLTAGVFPMSLHPPMAEWPGAALTAMGLFVWVDLVATFCWIIAIVIVAAPQWAILNALGVRCWSAAVLLGAALAPAPFFLIDAVEPLGVACLAATGGVSGLVVWLIAYRRAEGPAAALA